MNLREKNIYSYWWETLLTNPYYNQYLTIEALEDTNIYALDWVSSFLGLETFNTLNGGVISFNDMTETNAEIVNFTGDKTENDHTLICTIKGYNEYWDESGKVDNISNYLYINVETEATDGEPHIDIVGGGNTTNGTTTITFSELYDTPIERDGKKIYIYRSDQPTEKDVSYEIVVTPRFERTFNLKISHAYFITDHNVIPYSKGGLQYSINGGSWADYVPNVESDNSWSISVNAGDKIRWRRKTPIQRKSEVYENDGVPTTYENLSFQHYIDLDLVFAVGNLNGYWHIDGTDVYENYFYNLEKFESKQFKVYGNILSLTYGDQFIGKTDIIDEEKGIMEIIPSDNFTRGNDSDATSAVSSNGGFSRMFAYNAGLIDASNLILPIKTIPTSGYSQMFEGCSSLETPPQISPAHLSLACYSGMFKYCTGLKGTITIPEPLSILNGIIDDDEYPIVNEHLSIYAGMFYGTLPTGYPITNSFNFNVVFEAAATTSIYDDYNYYRPIISPFSNYDGSYNNKILPIKFLLPWGETNVFKYLDSTKSAYGELYDIKAISTDNKLDILRYWFDSGWGILYDSEDAVSEIFSAMFVDPLKYFAQKPLTFKAIDTCEFGWTAQIPPEDENPNRDGISKDGWEKLDKDSNLWYSLDYETKGDNATWQKYGGGIIIPAGQSISWKTSGSSNFSRFSFRQLSHYAETETVNYPVHYLPVLQKGRFEVYGNVNSILNSEYADLEGDHTYGEFCYMFYNSNVVSARNLVLPNAVLSTSMYEGMFKDCKELIYPPRILPAKKTGSVTKSYQSMFERCFQLETTPEILLTESELNSSVFTFMFAGCKSLKNIPHIRIKGMSMVAQAGLNADLFGGMFAGCSNLNGLKFDLRNSGHIGANGYLGDIFQGVTSSIPPIYPEWFDNAVVSSFLGDYEYDYDSETDRNKKALPGPNSIPSYSEGADFAFSYYIGNGVHKYNATDSSHSSNKVPIKSFDEIVMTVNIPMTATAYKWYKDGSEFKRETIKSIELDTPVLNYTYKKGHGLSTFGNKTETSYNYQYSPNLDVVDNNGQIEFTLYAGNKTNKSKVNFLYGDVLDIHMCLSEELQTEINELDKNYSDYYIDINLDFNSNISAYKSNNESVKYWLKGNGSSTTLTITYDSNEKGISNSGNTRSANVGNEWWAGINRLAIPYAKNGVFEWRPVNEVYSYNEPYGGTLTYKETNSPDYDSTITADVADVSFICGRSSYYNHNAFGAGAIIIPSGLIPRTWHITPTLPMYIGYDSDWGFGWKIDNIDLGWDWVNDGSEYYYGIRSTCFVDDKPIDCSCNYPYPDEPVNYEYSQLPYTSANNWKNVIERSDFADDVKYQSSFDEDEKIVSVSYLPSASYGYVICKLRDGDGWCAPIAGYLVDEKTGLPPSMYDLMDNRRLIWKDI